MRRVSRNCLMVAAFLSIVPNAARAVPVTYQLVSGSLDSVFLFSEGNLMDNCAGSIGGNCLLSSMTIDSASITLDQETGELLDLQIAVYGTGEIAMAGVNGYETVLFTGTSFSFTGTSALGSGANVRPFSGAAGEIAVDTLDMELSAALGGGWVQATNYSSPSDPNGLLHFSEGGVGVTLSGVEIGTFADPFGGPSATVEAYFSFSAAVGPEPAVPEPSAEVLFAVGFLILMVATRWTVPPVAAGVGAGTEKASMRRTFLVDLTAWVDTKRRAPAEGRSYWDSVSVAHTGLGPAAPLPMMQTSASIR